jgi:hypothetical protein
LAEFLADIDNFVGNPEDESYVSLSKDCILFKSLFTRDEQTKMPNLKYEVSIIKVKETHKINIATQDFPKYVNLSTSCTEIEVDQYTAFFK